MLCWATVKYDMHMTVIDGKVCNAVSKNKSTQRCYITRFRKYAKDTASCYVDLYDWYNMTCHLLYIHVKLLIHGAYIIENAVLPIGQLSKEAQEARNKDIKRLRECHSRKCSRMCTIEDVFNFLLISSDPH
jgi:hypothetical protein